MSAPIVLTGSASEAAATHDQALSGDTRPQVCARTGLPAAPRRAPGVDARSVSSAQLFGGAAELQISHHGAVYRLKQTALGKLILTK